MKNEQASTGTPQPADSRLPYEAPELIAYNQSEITMGGVVLKAVDSLTGDTNYRAS
ncbi:hypothetical protein CCP3SC15_70004 [Gammaproteobacteria bacterium]